MNTKLDRVLTVVELKDYMDRYYLNNKGLEVDYMTFMAMMEKISTLSFSRMSINIYIDGFNTHTDSEKIKVENGTIYLLDEIEDHSTKIAFNENKIEKIQFYISHGNWIDFTVKYDETIYTTITVVPM